METKPRHFYSTTTSHRFIKDVIGHALFLVIVTSKVIGSTQNWDMTTWRMGSSSASSGKVLKSHNEIQQIDLTDDDPSSLDGSTRANLME